MGTPTDPIDYPARLRAALAALQKQQARIDRLERQRHEPIAVIGMGCRFPGGATSPARFWSLLRDGVDAITEVPADRWNVDEFYDPDPDAPGKTYTRAGGFLDDVDRFDARFFRISPREAVTMDPQQRLLLEVSWEAFEDAAIPVERLAGSATGVFVGLTVEDYAKLVCRVDLSRVDAYTATGNVANIAAGRLSYFYGLRGPSLAVDTACSSSLVSLHLACQSLRADECEMAVAAGVNLILTPDNTIAVSRARMLSPDGRCKAFDAAANGYARSEGCGVVVLKRLSRAEADGNRILALIRGSAVRQDGARSGLTVPNGPAQQAVMVAALQSAGVAAADLGYIEAHGTGTSLGDPIEVEAIAGVYGVDRPRSRPLVIGALKTNVGHMESAAGIGGIIKTVLALRHGQIPPHLHLQTINPNIFLDEIPAVVPGALVPWPDGYERRLAGVSSFGSCGTIAHVILEAAPEPGPGPAGVTDVTDVAGDSRLLVLSAPNDAALADLASRFDDFLATQPDAALPDICHTAAVGRSVFASRVAAVGRTTAGMRTSLRTAMTQRGAGAAGAGGRGPDVGFLFTGQGALRAGSGRRLYETSPVFRAAIDRCAGVLAGDFPRPLPEVLFGSGADADDLLEHTRYGQPALFALQYALVELWKSWGIEPAVVVGHSLGEYAAACAAGVLGVEDGLRLLAVRGRLMQDTAPGRMVAVFADEQRCREAIADEPMVAIAALNARDETVIAGDPEGIRRVVDRLAARGIDQRPLRVERAFHSPLMAPMIDRYADALRRTAFRPARVKVIANVTGRWAGPEALAQPDYWIAQITSPVRFADCADTLADAAVPLCIEIGPAPVLTAICQKSRAAATGQWLASMRPGRDPLEDMLQTLGACFTAGCGIHGSALAHGTRRHLVALPTYPFQRERHWVDTPEPVGEGRVEGRVEDRARRQVPAAPRSAAVPPPGGLSFGIMFFNGVEDEASADKYGFMLDAARYADEHGFSSVWLPERHFTSFGSLYPNPATLHAAIARETRHVRLMAGSVVLPLQHPLRVVEEWSVVDNLSGGRVGMSFASGWNPDDFALAPDSYRDRHDRLFRGIEDVRRLWRGEAIETRGGTGQATRVRAYPTPIQRDLPLWVTAASNPATFERAGQIGAHVLTHLLDHEVAELAEKIARYRAARAGGGHDPATGQVVVMLHTFVGDDERAVHDRVRGPYCTFLKANAHLLKGLAASRGSQADISTLSPADLDAFVGFLYDRFFSRRGLIGTPETCLALVGQMKDIGVTEIACLLDFGPSPQDVMASLPHLRRLVELQRVGAVPAAAAPGATRRRDAVRASLPTASHASPEATPPESIYRITWPVVALAPRPKPGGRRWIVCADETGVGAAVVARLAASGQTVTTIARSSTTWEADLTAAVAAAPSSIVLYLWHLDAGEQEGTDAALQVAVRMVRAIGEAGARGESPRMWLVTRDAQLVGDRPQPVAPTQAALWGLARVLPIEQPRLWGGLIDLESTAEAGVAAAMIVDAATSDVREDQIACRGDVFHAARLTSCPLPAATRDWACRPDAAYLITGGIGGLGLASAVWLADKGARHVVLCSRTALPPRETWPTIADGHPQAPVVAAIASLEGRGVEVEVAALDIASAEDVAAFLRQRAGRSAPPIRGVVHAAGAWQDAFLNRMEPAMLSAVLRPKVAGTDVLDRAFQAGALDFFVAFSAFSSFLPAERQGSYAAANAYLDAVMLRRRQRGEAGLAVNWGPWSDIGFATTDYGARAHERLKTIGIERLAPADALQMLDRVVSADESALGIMPVRWDRLFLADPNAKLSPLLSGLLARHGAESERPVATADGPLTLAMLELPAGGQMAYLVAGIRQIVAVVMRIDQATIDDAVSFTDLGVDSLMAVEMKNRIQHETGIELPLVQLLQGPSVSTVAESVLAAIKMSALVSRPAADRLGQDLEEIEI